MRNIGRYVDIGITHQFFQRESFSNKSIFHRGRFFTKSTIVIIIIYIIKTLRKKHTFQKEEEEERIKMKLARFGRKFSADKAVKSNKKNRRRGKHKSVKYLKRKKEKMKNFRSRGRG